MAESAPLTPQDLRKLADRADASDDSTTWDPTLKRSEMRIAMRAAADLWAASASALSACQAKLRGCEFGRDLSEEYHDRVRKEFDLPDPSTDAIVERLRDEVARADQLRAALSSAEEERDEWKQSFEYSQKGALELADLLKQVEEERDRPNAESVTPDEVTALMNQIRPIELRERLSRAIYVLLRPEKTHASVYRAIHAIIDHHEDALGDAAFAGGEGSQGGHDEFLRKLKDFQSAAEAQARHEARAQMLREVRQAFDECDTYDQFAERIGLFDVPEKEPTP